MNRLPREVELAIIAAWLLGDSNEIIAANLKISSSTVSEIVSLLPSSLVQLRELNQHFRKIGLPPLSLRQLLERIVQAVDKGIDLEKLPTLVEYAVKAAIDAKYELTAVVDAAARVIQLEKESERPYQTAIKEFEEKTSESKRLSAENEEEYKKRSELQQENLALHNECLQAKKERRRRLRQAHITEKKISSFNDAKNRLAEFNLSFEDIYRLVEYFGFIKNSDCTPQEFGNIVQKHKSMREAAMVVESDLHERQSELEKTTAKVMNTRSDADYEEDRLRRNRAEADAWQKRAEYFREQAQLWEAHLGRVAADTQKQQCYHDAIVEQNIKNLRLNSEEAARYRLRKTIELRRQNLLENIKAHENSALQKCKSILKSLSQSDVNAPADHNLDDKVE